MTSYTGLSPTISSPTANCKDSNDKTPHTVLRDRSEYMKLYWTKTKPNKQKRKRNRGQYMKEYRSLNKNNAASTFKDRLKFHASIFPNVQEGTDKIFAASSSISSPPGAIRNNVLSSSNSASIFKDPPKFHASIIPNIQQGVDKKLKASSSISSPPVAIRDNGPSSSMPFKISGTQLATGNNDECDIDFQILDQFLDFPETISIDSDIPNVNTETSNTTTSTDLPEFNDMKQLIRDFYSYLDHKNQQYIGACAVCGMVKFG